MNHDFETFSELDVTKVGSWAYAKHPSTEALCMAYKPNGMTTGLWRKGEPLPAQMVDNPEPYEAFNWTFEYCIAKYVLGLDVDYRDYDCTAARARSYGLGLSLEVVSSALPLGFTKDMNGRAAMLKTCKPKKPSQKDPRTRYTPEDEPALFQTLYSYCITDTDAEAGIANYLPPWNPFERQIFEIDKTINLRGVPIDVDMCYSALDLMDIARDKYNKELKALTGYNYTQPAKIAEWCRERGAPLPNDNKLPAELVTEVLFLPDLRPEVRRALEIRQMLSKTSLGKYDKMLQVMDSEDHRIRFVFLYAGAITTLRWAGRMIQPHNFPRGSLKCPKDMDYDDFIDSIQNDFDTLSFDQLEDKYGNIPDLLSSLLRPTIKAPEGYEFYTSDFSNIEGRVLFWVSKCLEGLNVFYQGRDIYIEMAAEIYGRSYEALLADYEADDPTAKNQRQMGKQAILGLGYMMGAKTFLVTVAGYNIAFNPFKADWETVKDMSVRQFRATHMQGLQNVLDAVWSNNTTYVYGMTKVYRFDNDTQLVIEFSNGQSMVFAEEDGYNLRNITGKFLLEEIEKFFAQDIVNKYRGKFATTKKFWFDCERAAVKAVLTGQPQTVNEYITYYMWGDWLMCQLPSGRPICYYQPQLRDGFTPWGDPCKKLSYMGLDSNTNKWSRIDTYSGKLVENIVQAISRDLLASAMLRCEEARYPVVMHVHDEIVSLLPRGTGDLDHFNKVLCDSPAWASGCPIEAAGWHGVRYRKD